MHDSPTKAFQSQLFEFGMKIHEFLINVNDWSPCKTANLTRGIK